MPISLPQKASLAAHRLPPTNDPRVHPASPGRPHGRAGHCQPPPTTTPGQTDASAGPAPPAPASNTRLRLRQTTSRAWTQRTTTPTPAIPAVRLPAPPPRSRTSLRPDTADTATHKHRTPTPDAHTGRRTADTWTLRRPHRTLDIGPVDSKRGHWSLAPDTGHRTPDTGRGRGQADEGAAGIRTSWATTPSDRALGRPTMFLWTAPAALGSLCRLGGEAAFQREIASHRQLLGRSAGVERRLGALLSSDQMGRESRASGEASSVMAGRGCWPGRCSVMVCWRWWERWAALLRLDAVWVWEPVREVALEAVQVRSGGAVADVAVGSD
jgi:hypothetical protein